MKFWELIKYLDGLFPTSLSASWDNDGTDVCTNWNLEIGRILVALDVKFDVIDYAVTNGYNCVLSHHPMIYRPLKKLDLSSAAAKKAVTLAKHGVCAASFHTRLDSVEGGVNDCLIRAAGIAGKTEPLRDPKDNGIPVGRVVTLDNETGAAEFICGIKKSLSDFYMKEFSRRIEINANSAGGKGKITKVGVVSGSGMEFAEIAAEMGADAFLTGEGSYHDILDAYENYGINIITAGHYETEAVVLPFMKQKIIEKFPSAKVDCFTGEDISV